MTHMYKLFDGMLRLRKFSADKKQKAEIPPFRNTQELRLANAADTKVFHFQILIDTVL